MAKINTGAHASIGASLADADQARTPAPLEHRDDDAVRGADRQQVHDHGLERHEQAAEHEHQQEERQHQHRADEDRQALGGVRGEVVGRGGEPTDLHRDLGRR